MFEIGKKVDTIEELLEHAEYEWAVKREFDIQHGKMNKLYYVNQSSAYDIEATSYTDENENKYAWMYIWQFGINGYVYTGRTWDSFIETLDKVRVHYKLDSTHILPVYVHNLSYEAGFMIKRFEWERIFAREKGKPIMMRTVDGIEFRCSYFLSGCSLDQTCKDLTKYKVKKKTGDLDYDLIRTSETILSEKEISYAVYDVIGVMCFIQECIENDGNVTKIPMTKTGRVRNYCREKMFAKGHYKTNRRYFKALTLEVDEYVDFLKPAFMGGYTHANYMQVRKTHKAKDESTLMSWDFTSSYPAVMCSEKYPMTKGEKVHINNRKEYDYYVKNHGLIFEVTLYNIICKAPDSYLSTSKCKNLKGVDEDNGRILTAERVTTTITNIDFEIIEACYEIEDVEFGDTYIYEMEYLPRDFIECILDFYNDKTTLKDVLGMENEYMLKKGMLNSTYGCSVTDICNDTIIFDNVWGELPADINEEINKYNNNTKRFLFYPWGVFITAYARRNLFFGGILNCRKYDDGTKHPLYIYSDTDSIKIKVDKGDDLSFIDRYNEEITKKLTKMCNYYNMDIERIRPKTIKGKEKPLGVWDFDGEYKRFKTLGSKRYLVEYWDDVTNAWRLKCTISGVNKKLTSLWLEKFYYNEKNAFDVFDDFMTVPEEYAGRIVALHQIDDADFELEVEDYQGHKSVVSEKTYIHMSKSDYNLTMSSLYSDLLNSVVEVMSV